MREKLSGTFYDVRGLEPALELAADGSGKRRFRKQLIYTGAFVKSVPGQDPVKFSVDDDLVDHWHKSIQDFKTDGIDIPMPLGHTESPEARRATIVDSEVALDSKGRRSTYGILEFTDPRHESLAASSNVSIFVPPSFTSGTGKRYKWPIRHAAFTDYPVIPGLEPFQALAMSFNSDTALELNMPFGQPAALAAPVIPAAAPVIPAAPVVPAQQPQPVSLRSVATKLGILPTIPDDQLLAQIDAKITALVAQAPKPAVQPGGPPASPVAPIKPALAASFGTNYINMARENRKNKLLSLVREGKINSAAMHDLEQRWCTDGALGLSLSSTQQDPDGFESIVASLLKNDASPVRAKTRDKTGAQSTALLPKGESLSLSDNPLLKDAERRIAEDNVETSRNGKRQYH